ncbi:unnamed protein product [Miscanthus lutarioriparius]|uniref:Uncharacterized protein n=1 Tax=Miscanthus lutarioriparius TaxID=422564 RepID=A0A811R8V9_9POAL|nr:unnamed protein product [Miscanthus lutarioriparius]
MPIQWRKSFDSAVLLVSWRLGKERKARVFDNSVHSVMQVLSLTIEEANDWITAGFTAISTFLVAGSS